VGVAIAVVFLVVELALLILSIVAGVKIITKAGYSGWWVLITLVPLVGAVMFFVFAFSKWPIQQRLEAALMANQQPAGPGGPYGWSRGGGWAPSGGPQGPISPPGLPPQGWSQQPPSGPYTPSGGRSWN